VKNLVEQLDVSLLEEDGATLVEYGLMVALIAIVAIVGVAVLGNHIDSTFNQVATVIGSAGG